MGTNKKKIEINVFAIVLAVVLVAYTLTIVFPLFWTLMTTTKSNTEYLYFEKDGVIVEKDRLTEDMKEVSLCVALRFEFEGISYYKTYKIPVKFL